MQPVRTDIQTTEEWRLPMSYEEYRRWADEDVKAEWIAGKVIVHMPPKDAHQRLVEFLERLLALFVSFHQLGLVRIAPFEVRLWPDGPAREPDILFLAAEHASRLTEDCLKGSPDLIVEVISAESVRRDRSDKYREYEVAGVREYWILDSRPDQRRADFFRLDVTGRYDLFATEDDAIVHSTVLPGFWLRPAWLWEEPLPEPLAVLAEIVGVETLIERLRHISPGV